MTDSVFKGLDIGSLMSSAAAQPIGNQKAKYCADVATAIGTNPIYELQVGGVVKYRTTVSGSLAFSADGIALPSQFTEPPTVNAADALAEAVEVIRSASNPSIEIRTPLKVGGGIGFLSATKGLDGSYAVRTNARIIKAPLSLDVTNGNGGTPPTGSPTITMQRLIDDMTLASVNQPRFGTSLNPQAGGYALTYDNVKACVDDSIAKGHVFAYKHYDYMDEILPWFWVYAGVGHNDSLNLRLQYGYGVISVLRKSTNTWVDSSVRVGGFNGYVWDGNDSTPNSLGNTNVSLTDFGDFRDHADGTRSSRFTGNWGCELWYERVRDRSLIVDSKAVALICQCRIIDNDNNPYYGPNGCYAVHIGFDFWGRESPSSSFYQSGSKYWGRASNGTNSRWIDVKNGDWTSVAFIGMDPYNKSPGNAHLGVYSSGHPDFPFPWCRPPYSLTEAQVRANPPSWVTV